jgi:hypothetical protein
MVYVSIVRIMDDEDLTVEELKQRQLHQEQVSREQLAGAETPGEADQSRRRADKARYLREKLEEQEQADQQAESDR